MYLITRRAKHPFHFFVRDGVATSEQRVADPIDTSDTCDPDSIASEGAETAGAVRLLAGSSRQRVRSFSSESRPILSRTLRS